MCNLFKRIASSITAFAMTLTFFNGIPINAVEEDASEEFHYVSPYYESMEHEAFNDLDMYFLQELTGKNSGAASRPVFYSGSDTLITSQDDRMVFDLFVEKVTAIAAGELNNTQFTLEATRSLNFDFYTIYDCLLAEYPYEMYWHDKLTGAEWNWRSSGGIYTYTFTFYVSANYGSSTTITNRPDIATALATAQGIIAEYADKSDFEKLTGYKEEICGLVDYDYSILDLPDSYFSTNNSSWQLINVFDNNPSTKVVCEGYSKAYKLLCDMTTFNKEIYCYIVSGGMQAPSSTGPHMWNIVAIDDEYYHVDITNSDAGSIGQEGDLFFKGIDSYYSLSDPIAYFISADSTQILYYFDTVTPNLYPTECLNLSETDYVAGPEITAFSVTGTPVNTDYVYGNTFDPTGLTFTVTYDDSSSETIDAEDITFSELNVGDTSVTATYQGSTATITGITVSKATPNIGTVSVASPSKIYENMTVSEINLDYSNSSSVSGTLDITAPSAFTVGSNTISWTFTPSDTDNYTTVEGTIDVTVYADTLSSIEVTTLPTKTAYTYGDAFNPAGLVIEAAYTSGNTEEITYTDGNASAFTFAPDTLAVADTSVTVTYSGKSDTIAITVSPAVPSYTVPTGLTATYGDNLEDVTLPAGWSWNNPSASVGNAGTNSFAATYNNGNSNYQTVTENISVDVQPKAISIDSATVNDKTYDGNTTAVVNSVSFTGQLDSVDYTATGVFDNANAGENKTVTITVTLNGSNYVLENNTTTATASVLKDIVDVTVAVSGTVNTNMTANDVTFVTTATSRYNQQSVPGTTEFTDNDVEFTAGTKDYSVTFTPADANYDPVTTTVSITVVEDEIESVAVKTAPAKVIYGEGDLLDPAGLVITVTYVSGNSKDVAYSDSNESLFAFSAVPFSKGDTSTTFTYSGISVELTGLTVKGTLTASDFIFTAPTDLIFANTSKSAVVEAADGVTGIGEISVSYYNEADALVSPVNAGTYTVKINVTEGDEYIAASGLTDAGWTFTIEKADPELTPSLSFPSIVYTGTPVDSITLAHSAKNSLDEDVAGTIAFKDTITLTSGSNTFPVIFTPTDTDNYNPVESTVTFNVLTDFITGIEVTTLPTKTAYTYGDTFNPAGLVIEATYASGTTEEITYTDVNASEFTFAPDTLAVTDTSVTVTYNDKSDTISITVSTAVPSYTVPTGLTATYGDTLDDITLPADWSWNNPSASVENAGTNSFAATYNNGDSNYQTVTENISVDVQPKTISIDSATVNDKTYDGNTTAVVNSVSFTGQLDLVDYTATGVFDNANAGENKTVTITVTLNGSNYVLENNTTTATASVTKADPDVTVPSNVSCLEGNALSSVELPDGWVWDDDIIIPDNGNSYGATYTPADTDNYNILTANITVTVSACLHENKTTTTVPATCTQDGSITVVCDDCHNTVSSEVISAAHSWETDYTTDTEATCTTEGQKSIHCSVCDEIQSGSEIVIPVTHDWETDYTFDSVATCTTDGQKSIHCSLCDAIKPGSEIEIPAAHSWETEYTTDTEATCTTDGQKSIYCSICDELKPDSEVVIPAAHSWETEYTTDTEATCTTEGQKSIYCSICDELKPDSEVVIPAAHDWADTYSADETHHWLVCEACSETGTKDTHTGGTATPTSKAICSVCNRSYGDILPVITPVAPTIPSVSNNPMNTSGTEPQIKDENGKSGWNSISTEINLTPEGGTVAVDMNGTSKLPKNILEDIEGKNIDIIIDMGSGITWTINGEAVTNPKNIDLRVSRNVKNIPADIINDVASDNPSMEISLAHNGKLGFEAILTVSLGKKYNGLYANLYYYNESTKATEFIDCDLISGSNASFVLNHASDYVIVIDEEALGDDVSSASGTAIDSEELGDNASVSVMVAIPIMLAAGFVLYKKKRCR